MSTFNVVAPKLGESVLEITITKWFVKVNDVVEEDDLLFEVASDKVDSEIPSPVAGKIIKINYKVEDVVPVGETIAIIAIGDDVDDVAVEKEVKKESQPTTKKEETVVDKKIKETEKTDIQSLSKRFYSPLVKSIARKEQISLTELEQIKGSGKNERVRKQDVLAYLRNRDEKVERPIQQATVAMGAQDQIIEMDRMRRIIADHMVMSKKVSPHVTSVVEADVTNLWRWRNRVKDDFFEREGIKLTFTHLFTEATTKALRDFPMVNSAVDGYKIIVKKDINIGIAVALPTGNLIVPVIKKADQKNLVGLAASVNDLAEKARNNKLMTDDIQGGTFTITNFGSFRNLMGTPIINQPQVAILATGSIEKKPAIVETSEGDVILPRHKMYLSLSYDHRVIDGMLGGQFLRKIADYLEEFDIERKV